MRRSIRVEAVSLVVLAGIVTAVSGCGEGGSAPPPREPDLGIETIPGPKPVVGIAEANSWRRVPPPATPDEIAAMIAFLGATSHRFGVDWNLIEPHPPSGRHRYSFAPFDAMYRADLRHGIRPLLVVHNAPAWASDPGVIPGSFANNPPAEGRLGDWEAFLRAVARRYPRAVGIEIWNEPNLATFWGSGSASVRPDPLRYARLLAASYDAIKSVNPELPVVGGALAGAEVAAGAGDLPAPAFAQAMFDAGAAAHMDGFSVHPYPGTGGVAHTLAVIDQVRRARDAVGARTPLWVTEVGVTTTGPNAVTESQQARTLVAICRAISQQPGVEALYIHNLIEQTRRSGSREEGFGLTEPGWPGRPRPKQAFLALRGVFSLPGGCARAS
jgi:hypothetical protein